jgi:hypothetical protein
MRLPAAGRGIYADGKRRVSAGQHQLSTPLMRWLAISSSPSMQFRVDAQETEHRYEVKSSDDAGYVDGRDSTEAQDGQDQLRRSDRGGV